MTREAHQGYSSLVFVVRETQRSSLSLRTMRNWS